MMVGNNESLRFSATDIETYLRCPRQYQIRKVLGIAKQESEGTGFGSLVHSALERFNRERKKGVILPFSELEEYMHVHMNRKLYRCNMEFQQRKREGIQSLKKLYEYECSRDRAEILEIEDAFELPYIDRWGREHIMAGRKDVVYLNPDGTIEIVDYKSGKIPQAYRAKKIESKTHISKKPQSIIYYMAQIGQKLDDRVFVSYIFLGQSGVVFSDESIRSFTYTQEVYEEARALLDTCIDRILKGEFSTGSSFQGCRHCSFHELCQAMEGRQQ